VLRSFGGEVVSAFLALSRSEVGVAACFSKRWPCFGAKLPFAEHRVCVLGATGTGPALPRGRGRAERVVVALYQRRTLLEIARLRTKVPSAGLR